MNNNSRRNFMKGAVAATLAMQVQAGNTTIKQNNVSVNGMRRIAIEEAFVTQAIADEWDKFIAAGSPNEPGFQKMGESILADSLGTRIIHERLVNLGNDRIKYMDKCGVDMQVISLTSPGIQVFDGALAKELAADANDQLATAVKNHPDRFAGFAAVAPQLPGEAAKEIDRAIGSLGLSGVIINSHTRGEYLDDRKFWPILEATEARNSPLYLHPRAPGQGMVQPYLDYGLYFAGWGFAAETSLHAMRMIMSGVFDEFPKLKVILGHMGEGIPFHLDRIDNRYLLQVKINAVKPLKKLPSEYFKENFVITTSGVFQDSALKLCYEELGADRILFAADYPYESVEDSVKFLDAADLSIQDKHKIYYGNAEKLLGLATL
ncbi:MAG: 5-carboxyvanillate decarboxylase [Psychromonas sp.]|jgi:2,3-dihydroxybenzoate decarboxylase|uniref:amidohydrolase family protein n=1 Tax=Psychromonas sp. TaxID=1884585 RepID=UPI0039E41B79